YNFGLSAGQPGQPYDVYWDNLSVQSTPNTGVATATDECSDVNITYTDNIIEGNCASNYVIERTWVATDACGLTDECVQEITVQDVTGPVIDNTNTDDLILECDGTSDP